MCTTQGDLLFQENSTPSDSPLLKRRVYFLQAAARQWLSMSGLLKKGHFCPICHSFHEKPFSGSPHQQSQSNSFFFPLHSHRCHTHVILWGLFPPGMSPPSLTLVGIYHINLICIIISWYLLLRWCEQKVLLLRMVQEKEQRSIRDWLTCCLAVMEI